jgi:hypothetical protein
MNVNEFSIGLSDGQMEVLSKMVADSGLYSEIEVFNGALTLFAWAVEVVGNGGEVAAIYGDTVGAVKFSCLGNIARGGPP